MVKYKINTDKFVIREIDDNLILLDVDNGDFISTEGVGKLIIELIETHSLDEIVKEIEAKFILTENNFINSDIEQFIQTLEEKSIIKCAG